MASQFSYYLFQILPSESPPSGSNCSRKFQFVPTLHEVAPAYASGVNYISALWEHEQKQSVIGRFQHTPQAPFFVTNDGSALNLDPH
jgi:hypothetical protein